MTALGVTMLLGVLTLFTTAFLGWGYMQMLTEDRHRRERLDEAAAHREQIATLLQRIQAPEQAVVEHTAQSMPADPEPTMASLPDFNAQWDMIGLDPMGDS